MTEPIILTTPSERDIAIKLNELNLMTDPKEKKKQTVWFEKYRIPLFQHKGWYIILPDGISDSELHSHLHNLDGLRTELEEIVAILKGLGLKIIYERVDVDGRKIGHHTIRCDDVL